MLDIERVDTETGTTQTIKASQTNYMAIGGVLFVVFGLCYGCYWYASSQAAAQTAQQATATAQQEEAAQKEQAAQKEEAAAAAPTDTPAPPTPTPTNTPIPCEPMKCPSLIGLITYEYILRAGQPTPLPNDPNVYTQMGCKYSNIILDASGQRFYLVLDRDYRFPGDPTSRLGQFIIELTDMRDCHYPIAYMRDWYPFDQNVPDKPMTRVGENYQQPGSSNPFALQPLPTPTNNSPFAATAPRPDKPTQYYNTPPAPTPTATAATMNLYGRLTTITNCLQSNYGIATTSGEFAVIFDFGVDLPPLGYQGELTLIGQQTQLCNRAAIKVSKALYPSTPTPLPFVPPATAKPAEPTRTPQPSPTPQTVRLTGEIMRGATGCAATDLGFSNRGDFYYLIFNDLTDIQEGEATVLGQLVTNRCPNYAIVVNQISFSTTPTPEATIELFDDVGLHTMDAQ